MNEEWADDRLVGRESPVKPLNTIANLTTVATIGCNQQIQHSHDKEGTSSCRDEMFYLTVANVIRL
jgi:hypothetical protein